MLLYITEYAASQPKPRALWNVGFDWPTYIHVIQYYADWSKPLRMSNSLGTVLLLTTPSVATWGTRGIIIFLSYFWLPDCLTCCVTLAKCPISRAEVMATQRYNKTKIWRARTRVHNLAFRAFTKANSLKVNRKVQILTESIFKRNKSERDRDWLWNTKVFTVNLKNDFLCLLLKPEKWVKFAMQSIYKSENSPVKELLVILCKISHIKSLIFRLPFW